MYAILLLVPYKDSALPLQQTGVFEVFQYLKVWFCAKCCLSMSCPVKWMEDDNLHLFDSKFC